MDKEKRWYAVDSDGCYVVPMWVEDIGDTYMISLPNDPVPEEALLPKDAAQEIATKFGITIKEIK